MNPDWPRSAIVDAINRSLTLPTADRSTAGQMPSVRDSPAGNSYAGGFGSHVRNVGHRDRNDETVLEQGPWWWRLHVRDVGDPGFVRLCREKRYG